MSRALSHPVNSVLLVGTGARVGRKERELEPITLPVRDIFHTFCVGKSGYGKSRWLCSLALVLLSRHIPFILIDPAGDLARLLLQLLINLGWFSSQPDPFSRLLYLDMNTARNKGMYLPFNVLATGHDPYTTADIVLEAFRRAFPALKGGVMINIELLLKVCSYVLAVNKLPLFPYMYYLLTDYSYRCRLLSSAAVTDSLVKHFFEQHTHPKTGQLTIGADPTVKRLFNLCFAPAIRFSLGQSRNVLDFPTILANGTSVILNLQSPDPETTRLFGSLVTVSVELAAKARGDIPPSQRRGTHALLIDEFQNFSAQSGESFTVILDQCRKVGLYLVLATQSYTRIPEDVRGALSNTDIRAVFRLDEPDAKAIAPLLNFPINPYLQKPSLTPTPHFYSEAEQKKQHIKAIMRLPKRKSFLKLPDDRLYLMETLTINDPYIDLENQIQIESEYLNRYFVQQNAIEAEIAANLRSAGVDAQSASQPATIAQSYAAQTHDILPEREEDDEEDELDEYRAW
jgi:hypothetical protein